METLTTMRNRMKREELTGEQHGDTLTSMGANKRDEMDNARSYSIPSLTDNGHTAYSTHRMYICVDV